MVDLKIGEFFPLEIPPKYIPDQHFWEGFEACLDLVLNSLSNMKEEDDGILNFSTGDFFKYVEEQLIEEAELYKKDG